MALEGPHSQNQHHRCSGGRSSFGHNHCVEGDFLRHRASPVTSEEPLPATKGKIFYRRAEMRRDNGKSPKLELKLNLFVATTSRRVGAEEESSPNGSLSSSSSPPSSCVSSGSNSPEATSMVLAGCPRCLMYVMLSQKDLKCPKCKNAVLLDFLRGTTTTTTTTTDDNKNNSKKTRKS